MTNFFLADSLSVIIPTYNEEIHLPILLHNLKPLNVKCFIIDSKSTDKTIEIAKSYGCIVAQGSWKSFSEKLNWAIDNLPIKTRWIMRIDADETLTQDLLKELPKLLPFIPDDVDGIYVNRRLIHMGKWIKHGGCYPNKSLRIFRKGRAYYEEKMTDEKVLLKGKSTTIKGDIIDEKLLGMSFWTFRHIQNAQSESLFFSQKKTFTKLNSIDKSERLKRFAQSHLYYKLPSFFRAFLFWVYRYFLRLGFLDGKEGFIFHFLHAFWYRFFVDVLIFEQRQKHLKKDLFKKF